jgi:hypothetical protein
MIFSEPLLAKVLDGSKTVTRRPVKEAASGALHGDRWLPCRYEVGKTYAVQPGRGQKAVARIRILDICRKPLGYYMLTAECVREGFTHFTAFRNYWIALYGSYDPTQLVDRIEFELVQAEDGSDR